MKRIQFKIWSDVGMNHLLFENVSFKQKNENVLNYIIFTEVKFLRSKSTNNEFLELFLINDIVWFPKLDWSLRFENVLNNSSLK
jgi:hypothetical protein